MHSVLIANRGEIALRVVRACRDAGIRSISVYADGDRDTPHAVEADEAYALEGDSPAETYLNIEKLLRIAEQAHAEAVHPGYGFLAENAEFAAAVQQAGLIWIGPSPEAITALGDKVTARSLAQAASVPMAAGTQNPVESAEEVQSFAEQHGLPIAIKAAFGGGGRGLKVAHTMEEVASQFEAAGREAQAAFGRSECFVEQYLLRPRHVEAQVLRDTHGNTVVVGLRDCTLQRRHQKLIEEAPAPFLRDGQERAIREASRTLAIQAEYTGAGTVEFLVAADGTVSFLEVNTRLQVEHPVTEETTGTDLVLEQFRIADGQQLSFTTDPLPTGHSIEFRLNAENPTQNFLPSPGPVHSVVYPSGPGVRVDAGVVSGGAVNRSFDSMIAKLIVTGHDRPNAIARARRALAETHVEGVSTVLPFHRAVLDHPAFAPEDPHTPFSVHTRWIEEEFLPTWDYKEAPTAPTETEPEPRERIVVEVNARRFEVSVPVLASSGPAQQKRPPSKRSGKKSTAGQSGNDVTSPMQGSVLKVLVNDGDTVAEGDQLFVVEAMKMEQPITAHRAGTVSSVDVAEGSAISAGQILCSVN